jgi:hypothetical protein
MARKGGGAREEIVNYFETFGHLSMFKRHFSLPHIVRTAHCAHNVYVSRAPLTTEFKNKN